MYTGTAEALSFYKRITQIEELLPKSLLSNNSIHRELGFADMYSILIDALVVRTLAPAVMPIMGKWSWYNP
jgi:hypothetical protein